MVAFFGHGCLLVCCCWFCSCLNSLLDRPPHPSHPSGLRTCLISERSQKKTTAPCRWTEPALSCCTGTPRCCTPLALRQWFWEPGDSSLRPGRRRNTAYALSGTEGGGAAHHTGPERPLWRHASTLPKSSLRLQARRAAFHLAEQHQCSLWGPGAPGGSCSCQTVTSQWLPHTLPGTQHMFLTCCYLSSWWSLCQDWRQCSTWKALPNWSPQICFWCWSHCSASCCCCGASWLSGTSFNMTTTSGISGLTSLFVP